MRRIAYTLFAERSGNKCRRVCSFFLKALAKVLSALLVLSLIIVAKAGQSANCDQLKPRAGDDGYKRRNGKCNQRCEGMYVSDVSSKLQIVSLLQGSLDFPWQSDVVLEVRRPSKIKEPVNLRALAIPVQVYYRMDATLGSDSFCWPIGEILNSLRGLKPNQLGAYGWIGTEDNKIFIPLQMFQTGARVPAGPLIMQIRSASRIEELLWRTPSFRENKWQKAPISHTSTGALAKIDLSNVPGSVFEIEIKAKERHSDIWPGLRIKVRRS